MPCELTVLKGIMLYKNDVPRIICWIILFTYTNGIGMQTSPLSIWKLSNLLLTSSLLQLAAPWVCVVFSK